MRAVITRAAHQAEELASPLREHGFDVISLPLIELVPPLNPEPLKLAALDADKYDWVIFTSANAVDAFYEELRCAANTVRGRIAAVGPATRQAAEQKGFTVNLVPGKYVAESLLEAFGAVDLAGKRLLIPCAAGARDLIPTELRKRGAIVDVVEAYRNVVPQLALEQAPGVFREPYPEWVLFASSSAIDNLVALVGIETLRHSKLASIGPITSATIERYGLPVSAEAAPHTIEGLVDAITKC